MRRIVVYDTTLRDGTQGAGVTFSVEDKLEVARRLDGLGFDYIEGGWPGSARKTWRSLNVPGALWPPALGDHRRLRERGAGQRDGAGR